MRGHTPIFMSTRILLITHAPLAQALHACAAHVFPDCAAELLVLDVPAHEAPEATLAAAQALLAAAPALPQTLVLTDVLGATPCNVAQRLVQARSDCSLVTGVNLPMLLRALCYRHEALDTLVSRAVDGGKAGVMRVENALAASTLRCPCP